MKLFIYLFIVFPALTFSSSLARLMNEICSEKILNMDLSTIYSFNQADRDKWVQNCAKNIDSGSKVLDVGAGTCLYRHLFSHCEYFTHDFKQNEDIQYGKIDFVSDIVNIPIPNESFDVIICTEVLEHVPYPIDAINEMVRILKKGGKLILTAPFSCGLHQLPYHYYTGYTPVWYEKILNDANCNIEEITPNGGFFKMMSQEVTRAYYLWEQYKGEYSIRTQHAMEKILAEILPRFFYDMDEKCFHDQFTVGYHVIAEKM